jgi:hypothetical protein
MLWVMELVIFALLLILPLLTLALAVSIVREALGLWDGPQPETDEAYYRRMEGEVPVGAML